MFDILELNPLEVGNFGTLAAFENDQEEKVNRLMDSFQCDDRWRVITVRDLENAFDYFGVDYPNLPQFLKDRIDELDVI